MGGGEVDAGERVRDKVGRDDMGGGEMGWVK